MRLHIQLRDADASPTDSLHNQIFIMFLMHCASPSVYQLGSMLHSMAAAEMRPTPCASLYTTPIVSSHGDLQWANGCISESPHNFHFLTAYSIPVWNHFVIIYYCLLYWCALFAQSKFLVIKLYHCPSSIFWDPITAVWNWVLSFALGNAGFQGFSVMGRNWWVKQLT